MPLWYWHQTYILANGIHFTLKVYPAISVNVKIFYFSKLFNSTWNFNWLDNLYIFNHRQQQITWFAYTQKDLRYPWIFDVSWSIMIADRKLTLLHYLVVSRVTYYIYIKLCGMLQIRTYQICRIMWYFAQEIVELVCNLLL